MLDMRRISPGSGGHVVTSPGTVTVHVTRSDRHPSGRFTALTPNSWVTSVESG